MTGAIEYEPARAVGGPGSATTKNTKGIGAIKEVEEIEGGLPDEGSVVEDVRR